MVTRVLLALGLALLVSNSHAGQFKRITIDGAFDDWLGVPVVGTSELSDGVGFDLRDLAIANDEEFLYIRARLHRPANYGDFNHQVVVDTDADAGTGFAWGGVGSELFMENGGLYQQKNGAFNEGAGSNLAWAVAPSGVASQFEMRLSRAALDAEGLPFFDGDEIAVAHMILDANWAATDAINGIPYTFATQPERFQGSATLTDFETTFWFYQEVDDPTSDWLLPDYLGSDTWKGDKGFFSFGVDPASYPAAVSVPLTPGRTTYYFRVPFVWGNAAEGVALLADAIVSDGAVIYLNGDEVRRIRMPDGAIDGSTQALGGASSLGIVERFSLPASALIVGENLLMVEVHQAPDSLDSLAFGLSLVATDSLAPSFEEPEKPLDRSVVEGEASVFTAGTIAGTEPFAYQWLKDGNPIEGATNARFEISRVLETDAGTYSVIVSNGSGSIQSREAVLTTTAIPVSLANPAEPRDATISEGETVILSVSVSGSPLLAYQWYKDEVLIDGATEPTLTISEASLADSGDYEVLVSNRVNSLTSRKARVQVRTDVTPPAVETIASGASTLTIQFNEPLDPASAADVAHYSVEGLSLTSVSVGEDLQTVTLTTAPQRFGETYALHVDGVKDRFGNATNLVKVFRASILIDGDFSDWEGLEPVASDPLLGDGPAFSQFWVANDKDYLYLRFSFHQEVGALPVDHYYHIYFDGDDDPATGLTVSTVGSSLMVENGLAWLQRGGQFNEGGVPGSGFVLAPTSAASEFECRIALATKAADGTPIFTAGAVGVTFELISTSWAVVAGGPVEGIRHVLTPWPDLSDPGEPNQNQSGAVTIDYVDGKIRLHWLDGSLESSDSLLLGSWVPVPAAQSPHSLSPDAAARFFRVAK